MTTEIKKYELLQNDTLEVDGHTLYRIRALCKFGNICEFEEGGYIEGEHNLSHEGHAWVGGDAQVFEKATITDDAEVFGKAVVRGSATVYASAKISEHAQVYESAHIGDRAHARSSARVFGQASVLGTAHVTNSHVYGNARIREAARIIGGRVYGSATVEGNACVHAHAEVCGAATLGGNAVIRCYGHRTPFIANSDSWMTFNNVGSENGVLTVYLAVTGDLLCTRGCFTGTVEDFLNAVKQDHGTNHIAQEYGLMIQTAMLRLGRRPFENLRSELAEAVNADEE